MEGRVKRQVTFLAPGTQGDVEPLRLVAQAIAETGRVSVLFACDALYHHDEEEEGSSREAAIVYMPLTSAGENPEANRGKGATTMKGDGAEALWKVQLSEYEQLVETSDLVVYNWFASWCRHVCQKYGVKSLGIWPVPFTATSEFPSFLFCSPKMKKVSSKLSHAQSHLFWESVFWKSSKNPLLKWRKENGLRTPLGVNTVAWEQRGHFSLPGSIMYCFSPQVVPRPLDWPGSVELCGYIRQQQSPKSLPHALDDLGLGEDETCRIHIGFGSATKSIPRPEKLLKTLILGIQKAMKKTAFKVLLCRKLAVEAGNWVPNEFITIVDYIPYESLLSRVDIHIHHGGEQALLLNNEMISH